MLITKEVADKLCDVTRDRAMNAMISNNPDMLKKDYVKFSEDEPYLSSWIAKHVRVLEMGNRLDPFVLSTLMEVVIGMHYLIDQLSKVHIKVEVQNDA